MCRWNTCRRVREWTWSRGGEDEWLNVLSLPISAAEAAAEFEV
ncbi:MAG: hypothetical protein QOE61_2602, partial [Micromonosporaceae bacterium]|nr:hypothetical protein [Micromonosporaceae bacterium]